MPREKGNKVFREVMRGTRDRTPSPQERAKDAQRAREVKAESDRMKAESRAINMEMDRQKRAEAAHQRAEKERREMGK